MLLYVIKLLCLGTADRFPKENCTNTTVITYMRMKCHGEVGQIILRENIIQTELGQTYTSIMERTDLYLIKIKYI